MIWREVFNAEVGDRFRINGYGLRPVWAKRKLRRNTVAEIIRVNATSENPRDWRVTVQKKDGCTYEIPYRWGSVVKGGA